MGAGAGATRASITSHFALRGNLADVSAKENAQETAVNLVGLLLDAVVVERVQRREEPRQHGRVYRRVADLRSGERPLVSGTRRRLAREID